MNVSMRAKDRFRFKSEDRQRLTSEGRQTAWARMMRVAVAGGINTAEQRFGMYGLKHRGITDTKGDKKAASGHKTDAMVNLYGHSLSIVYESGGES